jgi:hypothetical protein
LDHPTAIVIDTDVDAGSSSFGPRPETEGASLHGDDLVGVYPNRGAVDESELEHWHWIGSCRFTD